MKNRVLRKIFGKTSNENNRKQHLGTTEQRRCSRFIFVEDTIKVMATAQVAENHEEGSGLTNICYEEYINEFKPDPTYKMQQQQKP